MASGGQEVRGWWSGKASVEVIELWEGAWQQREHPEESDCLFWSFIALTEVESHSRPVRTLGFRFMKRVPHFRAAEVKTA